MRKKMFSALRSTFQIVSAQIVCNWNPTAVEYSAAMDSLGKVFGDLKLEAAVALLFSDLAAPIGVSFSTFVRMWSSLPRAQSAV
ncbi:hypothetical protein [Hyphomicrobium facile]|nr:hypothetical protein [Hyphomicrobium facile]